MALTKSSQTPQASTTQTAGSGDTVSSAQDINYGVSGVAQITNGGTGPTVGCDFYITASNGGSFVEIYRATAPLAASTTYYFPFSLGVGGQNGDWKQYKTGFGGNTGQNVTIQADACTTTAL